MNAIARVYVCTRAKALGFIPDEVLGRARSRDLVRVRAIIAKELRAEPWSLSLPEIGAAMNRHHTTVMNLLGIYEGDR